jgi:predicted metal-binding membrane protein
VLLPGLLYAGGWLMMSAAMMLPTVLLLLPRFDRLAAARSDRVELIALLSAGCLLVWLGFGVAAHLLDATLHAMATIGWVDAQRLGAGRGRAGDCRAVSFSRLKYYCLDECRTPLSFIIQHWHGVTPRRDAFLLDMQRPTCRPCARCQNSKVAK